MKNQILCIIFFSIALELCASTSKYRLIINNDPSTRITIGWEQISGSDIMVYYGTTDYGTVWTSYPNSKAVERSVVYKGMTNSFVELTNLTPDTNYYFVIKDSEGTSNRFWFKTAPVSGNISLIAGGDSGTNLTSRQNANKLVAKLKPHAILFNGNMTAADNDSEWQTWLTDWQLTIATDGRMFPIIPVRGKKEFNDEVLNKLFNVTIGGYYKVSFGANLLSLYNLNSEIEVEKINYFG